MSQDGTLDLFEPSGADGDAGAPSADEPGSPAREPASDPAPDPGADPDLYPGPGEDPEEEPRAGSDGPRIWSVSEINSAVRTLLEETIPPVWIGGEVGGWTRARSGHCYFTLKDDRAQLRCVMWRREAARLPTDPEEGMKVRAFGGLTLYEARGEYQLAVRKLEAEGEEGLWRLAFERLRKKLEAEGLLAPERKRAVPRFPEAVGVVTSATGAAFRDILHVIRRRAPWTRVVIRSTRVQGEGASEEIARALDALAGSGLCQLVIVGRGGGSIEDLWAFNEEPVARAIARSPVPVISAVGHEVDVTIADLVADFRAPTPSAAAEAAVQDREAILELLRGVRPRLARSLQSWVESRRRRLERGRDRMERAVRRKIEVGGQRLHALAGRAQALSPLSTLRRGYAVPLGPDGDLLRSAEDFVPGDSFTLRVVDGRVDAQVRETVREELEIDAG